MLVQKTCSKPLSCKQQAGLRTLRIFRYVFQNARQDVKIAVAKVVLPPSEEARRSFRTVYDFQSWRKHRNQLRLFVQVGQIPRSNILKNILPSMAWCTGVAALLTLYMQAYDSNLLPEPFPSFASNTASVTFVNTTVVALSLLLVFRTNASYGRWDEARKMKGLLVNRSRDLIRQACSMFSPEDVERKIMMGKWVSVYCRVLRIHFQAEVSLEEEMNGILSMEEVEWLQSSTHRPCTVIHVLSQIIYSAPISAFCQAQMCNNLTALEDVLGGCERILRAPIPVSYTRNTARFLFVWLTLLPFALFSSCGVWTAPVVAGIAAVLCGIEEIGVQVEEPFGILPLAAIGDRIQADVISTLLEDGRTRTMRSEVNTAALRAMAQPPNQEGVLGSVDRQSTNLANSQESTTGSNPMGQRVVLLSKLETETKDMKDNLNKLKQRATELSMKAQLASEAAQRERASAVQKLGIMNEQLKGFKGAEVYSEIAQLKDTLTSRESDVATVVSEMQQQQLSSQQLFEQLAHLQTQLSEAEALLSTEKSMGQELSQQLQLTQMGLKTNQASLLDVSHKLQKEELQRSAFQTEIQALRRDLDRITTAMESKRLETEAFWAAAESAEQHVADSAALQSAMMAELTETSDAFAERLAAALSRAETAETDKFRAEQEVKMLQSKIADTETMLRKLEAKAAELERKGSAPSESTALEFRDAQWKIAELEGLLGEVLLEVKHAASNNATEYSTQDKIHEVQREADRRSIRVAAEIAAERGARSEAEDNLRILQRELLLLKEDSLSSRNAAERELKEMQLLICEVKAKAASTATFVGTAAAEGPRRGQNTY
ncbi:hypothetical protein CEUSTIGMA_g4348.t1 [Chlamydomonas eustigma]|uniref:Uncharacterized protein n=1 Tax=Chlamydomonas eustigma TaxID=1157962 RepID=A0A250X1Y4_9CHLO|nr:hypothetical protein CEUSTIGMA_g4348.t1 [Chlamydomonas eustigma]|eukprot:GAX76902.1 hypothetical protein CEUSTIGMA_g4348.t1 [Chlamydomonas eustigma]